MSRRDFYGINIAGAGLPAVCGPGYSVKDKEGSAYNYIAYMLDRTQQIFEWRGLPDTIPARNFELLLQVRGYAGIADVNGKLYALWGGLGGEPDAYYMPTICTVANPALNLSRQYKIDKDIVVIPNDALYMGLLPMYARYGELLAENDLTFRVLDILERMREFISAPDDNSKAAADEFIRGVEKGNLASVSDSLFLDGVKQHSGSHQTSIMPWVEYGQYIRAMWFNELGINANYNMKREKLNDGEVNMTNTALLPLVDNMLRCRKEGAQKVNDMFGTQIDVEFTGVWESMKKIAEEDPESVAGSAQDPERTAEDETTQTAD